MKYLALALGLAVLVAGCTGQSLGIDSLVKSTPQVKAFLAEYPNAKLTTNLLGSESIANQLTKIRENCDNEDFPLSSYYKTVLTDPDSNTKLTVWTDSTTFDTVCIVREAIGQKPKPVPVVTNQTTTTSLIKKGFGSKCSYDYECESNQCINGICNATVGQTSTTTTPKGTNITTTTASLCSSNNCAACTSSSSCNAYAPSCVWFINQSSCFSNATSVTSTTSTLFPNATSVTSTTSTLFPNATTTTTIANLSSKIDLAISILSALKSPQNPDPYTLYRINVSVAILNNGTEDAKNVYSYITLYYKNTTFISSGCAIDKFDLPALKTITKICTLDQTRSDASEIVARVDPGNVIPEFDETNNERRIIAP